MSQINHTSRSRCAAQSTRLHMCHTWLMLETERLILRSFTLADIPDLVPLISAREVAATTLRIPHPYVEAHAREFITNMGSQPEGNPETAFAIVVRDGNRLCGGISLRVEREHQRAELGYWIGVPYWGNGYATEASLALLRYGFDELELQRIFASHFQHNAASANVLRKIGMRHEGCQRAHILKWGQFLDSELYGILRSEWSG
jgi:[ribosomal protein S5]-alanine N-acetyltransferase